MRTPLFAGLLLTLGVADLGAQVALAGTVRDSGGRPVTAAEVSIAALQKSVIADDSGHYAINGVTPGMRLIQVRRVGFAPFSKMIRIGESATVDFVLTSLAVKLDTVRTTEQYKPTDILMMEYLDNRKMGLGHFVTRDMLEKMNGAPIAEAFDHVNDIIILRGSSTHAWIANSRVKSLTEHCQVLEDRGPRETVTPKVATHPECTFCFPTIYVDFTRLSMTDEVPNVNRFVTTGLESVEVFASPAQLPSRYISGGSACGVVVFHARRQK